MLSLEREVLALPVPEAARLRIAALERREIVSLRTGLRALLWVGVALISGGVGTLLARNIERIGHLTLILAIAAASAVCYFFAWRMMRRRGNGPALPVPTAETGIAQEPGAGGTPAPNAAAVAAASPVGEYLLLLGALLLSADVAYAEAQLNLLGDAWRWHLLILAVVHGATAYTFASRKVLSLAIVALAGVFGVTREGEFLGVGDAEAAARFTMAGAAIAAWRVVHHRASARRSFDFPLEQAAFHLAMIGSIIATSSDALVWLGLAAALILATLAAFHAIREREESFLVFAILYAVLAIDIAIVPRLGVFRLAQAWIVATSAGAGAILFAVHLWWKERFA